MNASNPIGPSARIRARIASATAVCTDAVWRRPARMAPVDERLIRRAASAVCIRPATERFEVLVVQRSEGSRFLPGYLAFPGGAVDTEDDARAERWFGDPADAPRVAAVRELAEEVGLTLTAEGLVAAVDLAPADHAPPIADQISPLCHWVAPP